METVKAFGGKVMKDNIGFLASAVAWTVLTSIVPICVGFLGISGLILRNNASAQTSVEKHLSSALAGVLKPSELHSLVGLTVQHAGILGIIGILGVLWGGANVGGSLSTVFQPIFQVKGRDFLPEKLIDIGMIFVFVFLMLVIIVATTASSVLNQLFSNVPLPPGWAQFAIGVAISLLAAFLLFATIYLVFPNTAPRFKFHNVWPGSLLAAVLFQILSFIFPLYTAHAHFTRYGALLGQVLILTAWIYFFALITIIGAEVVAYKALRDAQREGKSIGPEPDGSVPQRSGGLRELKNDPPTETSTA